VGLAAQTKPDALLARGPARGGDDGRPPLSERWTALPEHQLFAPIAEASRAFAAFDRWPAVFDLNRLLGAAIAPFRFVVMRPRSAPRASYDASIVLDRAIPTREENWHDFFNALVWASFPRTKAALHARQYDERLAHGPGNNRSRTSDLLTCLDEGGAILESAWEPAPCDAGLGTRGTPIPTHDELTARGDRVSVFGHATYEHLLRDARVTATAAMVVRPARDLDREVAAAIDARGPLRFGRIRLMD
jgi:hypothetical protein